MSLNTEKLLNDMSQEVQDKFTTAIAESSIWGDSVDNEAFYKIFKGLQLEINDIFFLKEIEM